MATSKELINELVTVGKRLKAMRTDVRRSEQDIVQAANAAFKAAREVDKKGIEAVAKDVDIAEKEIADAMIDMIRGFYDMIIAVRQLDHLSELGVEELKRVHDAHAGRMKSELRRIMHELKSIYKEE